MKHEIEWVQERNVWQLKVFNANGSVKDIIEGPFRTVYQWSMDYWGEDPELKIRRVRPRKRWESVGERTPTMPQPIDDDAEPEDEVERKPINATWMEFNSFYEHLIKSGSMAGQRWQELYERLPDGRYLMLSGYVQEYGR